MTFTFTIPSEKAEISDFAHFFEIKPHFKIGGLNSEIPITSPDQEKSPNGEEKNEQDGKLSVNNIQLQPT